MLEAAAYRNAGFSSGLTEDSKNSERAEENGELDVNFTPKLALCSVEQLSWVCLSVNILLHRNTMYTIQLVLHFKGSFKESF